MTHFQMKNDEQGANEGCLAAYFFTLCLPVKIGSGSDVQHHVSEVQIVKSGYSLISSHAVALCLISTELSLQHQSCRCWSSTLCLNQKHVPH